MQLQEGGFYLTRDGRRVGPIRMMKHARGDTIKWESDDMLLPRTLSNWADDGTCFPGATQLKWTNCDLVEETA